MAGKKVSIAVDKAVLDEYKSNHVFDLVGVLKSAPASVSLLGQLCLLSFSVPDIEFTYRDFETNILLYSSWYCAGLQQVVAAGSDALCFAEEKLREIEPQARLILKGILNITNLTLKGKQMEIVQNLPKLLKDVAKTSGECMDMAKKVEAKFEYIIQLIMELSVVITEARSYLVARGFNEYGEAKYRELLKLGYHTKENKDMAKINELEEELNVDEGNKDTLAKINGLMEGLKALSKVKQEWEKLVKFFNFLFSLIENEMHGPLTQFLSSIENINDRKVKEGKISNFVQNNLQKQANKLATTGAQVTLVTTLYLEILQIHLVGHLLVTLDSLLTITDEGKRIVKAKEMEEKCALAVTEIVKQKDRRIESAEKDFKKLLGIRS